MEIIITQWASDSYLELVSQKVFTRPEYLNVIRPDVMLLNNYPTDAKFSNSKFWSKANDMNGKVIPDGFKMKWHNVGDGRIQLRLTVGLLEGEWFCVRLMSKKMKRQISVS